MRHHETQSALGTDVDFLAVGDLDGEAEEAVAAEEFGEEAGGANVRCCERAVGGGLFADVEEGIVGVDGLQVEGRGGVGGEDAEGDWGKGGGGARAGGGGGG